MRNHGKAYGEEEPVDAVIDSVGARFMVLLSLALLLATLAVVAFAGERADSTASRQLQDRSRSVQMK